MHFMMCKTRHVSNLQHREKKRHRGHLEQLSHAPVQDLEVGVCRGVLRALTIGQHDCQGVGGHRVQASALASLPILRSHSIVSIA